MINDLKLYIPYCFNDIFNYYKNIDFLYKLDLGVIISSDIFINKQNNKAQVNMSKALNITQDFYEGFDLDF